MEWTGGNTVSTETYFYRINAGPYNKVNKMTLIN
jgi:hypothetical protein